MSKRGSINALRFAGRNWSVGGIRPKKKRKKTKKEIHFEQICDKFNFKQEYNPNLYSKFLVDFKGIKSFKERVTIIKRVDSFKIYAIHNNIDFDINIFFKEKYYLTDFKKKYPELYKKKKQKTETKGLQLMDFLNSETLIKLKSKLKK